jgi:colanic acid biosynthesis protein WcaH
MGYQKYILGRKRYNYFRSFFIVFAIQTVINFGTKSKPKILLVKRTQEPCKGQWWIPGGVVFKTEPSLDALKRIVRREVGLECKVVKMLSTARETYKNMPGTRDKVSDYYSEIYMLEPKNKNAKIHIDDTSSSFKFVEKIEKNFHPYLKQYLKQAGLRE